MTLAEWVVLHKYRALTDQALKELMVILAEEGKDDEGVAGIQDRRGAKGVDLENQEGDRAS